MPQDPLQLLHIYLDDHWAGAAAGLSLARRMLRNNRRSPSADDLTWLVAQIEADLHTLVQVRRRLGADGGGVKRALAMVAERVARLKPNGRLLTYSPLSRVLEAEAMISAVAGKHRLWVALRYIQPRTELADFDFEALERRAEEQLELLRSFHRKAADMAFSGDVKGLV